MDLSEGDKLLKMKKVSFIILTLVLAVILLAIEVVIVKSASKYEPESSIVFAKTRIPENTVIQEAMLLEKKVNISMIHRQSIRNIRDAIGKRARIGIEEGEMILTGKLSRGDEMEEIEVKDKNNRLFSVEFKGDQANGWWLMTGQYVDIIFIPNEKARGQAVQQQVVTSIQRLRNIRIAALIDEKGKLLKNYGRSTLPKYISFEVTDEQCEFLAYAKSNGRLEISVIP